MPREWVLVRIMPNGSESVIATLDVSAMTHDEQQAIREELLAAARDNKQRFASRRFVVYDADETDGPRVPGNWVWDSAVDL